MRRLAVLLVVLALPVSAAHAEVLVSGIPDQVRCGADLRPGVWYQSYSGGSRRAVIAVRRAGRTVFRKRVRARDSWRYWHVPTQCGARYTVVYRVAGQAVRFPVRVG